MNAGVQIAPAAPADAPRAKPAFGTKDTWRWQVLLGGMTDFESAERVVRWRLSDLREHLDRKAGGGMAVSRASSAGRGACR